MMPWTRYIKQTVNVLFPDPAIKIEVVQSVIQPLVYGFLSNWLPVKHLNHISETKIKTEII